MPAPRGAADFPGPAPADLGDASLNGAAKPRVPSSSRQLFRAEAALHGVFLCWTAEPGADIGIDTLGYRRTRSLDERSGTDAPRKQRL